MNFKNLRPESNYSPYPPYHTGEYLEEYFYAYYKQNKISFDKTGYTLIPVFWTNIYHTRENINLVQPYLDSLPNDKYFTVSQHDDAVREVLPENTISFEAGGNGTGIPLPLICSPLPQYETLEKDIFCSFVGSTTHNIRNQIADLYGRDSSFVFVNKSWTLEVCNDDFNVFINTTRRSKFTLCPRGYGAQSFRLYEALQLESVPVVVYDKRWFAFEDRIDWSSFCVLVHCNEIETIKDRLLQIDDSQYQSMLKSGKRIYSEYFTMKGMSENILKTLQTLSKI